MKIEKEYHLPELKTGKPEQKIALEGVKIRSFITGLSQEVIVEQRFRNMEDVNIEAVYTFPLPDDAAVCSLTIRKAESILTGEIEEKEKAHEMYVDAIDDGDLSYLLESNRPDIFTIHVGNLAPGETVAICIGYISTLKIRDDSIRLAFPTTISPRYVPEHLNKTEDLLDTAYLNPPHTAHVPFGLDLKISLQSCLPVETIDSPSHEIELDYEAPEVTTVRLVDGITEMDRDVVINLSLKRQEEPLAICADGPNGDRFVSLMLFPEINQSNSAHIPTETHFVIDASGSMSGYQYTQAVRALKLCLRSLGQGDTFNIIRFGSSFETWKDEPVIYNNDTLEEAIGFLDCSTADLGGTELLRPLEELFSQPVLTGNIREVILLTDGQVSNENEIHSLASAHSENNRIFTFGIGAACSMNLVNGIAEKTGGASEFIQEGESIEEKVLRTFSRMGTPRIDSLKISFQGVDDKNVRLATRSMPPVFEGDAFIMHAKISGQTRPLSVQLSGKGPDGPLEWNSQVTKANEKCRNVPHLAWARIRIGELESRLFERRRRPENTRSQKIVDLSKKHGVLSKMTGLIAIEERSDEERFVSEPELRRVPLQHTYQQAPAQSYSEIVKASIYSTSMNSAPALSSPASLMDFDECVPDFSMSSPKSKKKDFKMDFKKDFKRDFAKSSRKNEGLFEILDRQDADGCIELDRFEMGYTEKEIMTVLKAHYTGPKGHHPESITAKEIIKKVAYTLHALAVLEKDYAKSQNTWIRSARKATAFLLNHVEQDILDKISKDLKIDILMESLKKKSLFPDDVPF